MEDDILKRLSHDVNGLQTYEYIANNIGAIDDVIVDLARNMVAVDTTGQFVVSTARYLHAIDAERYSEAIDVLIKAAIDKDRDHRYLPDLIAGIWGGDYQERAQELSKSDDNFRRIYKRLYPSAGL